MRVLLAIGLTLLGAVAAVAAQPARQTLQAACFSAASLTAIDHERVPRRTTLRQSPPVVGSETVGALRDGVIRQPGAVRRVTLAPGSPKLVALTLDFCEQSHEIAGYDGAVIDVLRRENVPATLFVGGKWMATHETRFGQLLSDPLFEIGAHGWVHRNARGVSGATLRAELLGPAAAYQAARSRLASAQCAQPHATAMATVPRTLSLTRFPFGACHPESLEVARAGGLVPVQWDVSTGDASPEMSAGAIAATILRQTKPGSIILAHANGRGHNTAAALPAAIQGLRAKGFVFVTVGDLLAAGQPEVVSTCFDRTPGDTDKYDRFFAR